MSVRSLFASQDEATLLNVDNEKYFVIDGESRSIIPPADFKNFGVESDENAKRVYFKCPRIVGDNLDLTTLNLRVNYQNAKGEKDKYLVTDVVSDGDYVHFSWLLSRKCTMYSGIISFIVCAVKTDDAAIIKNEWNTTLCTGVVLGGLEVENPEVPEDTSDLVNQLVDIINNSISEAESKSAEAVENVKAAEEAAIENIGNSLDILLLKKDYANGIKGKLSGEIVTANDVSPVEHEMAVKVHGKNLFDVSKVITDHQNQVINNGDGTITVNTSATSAAVPIIELTLKELAEHLEVGKTYVLSAITTGRHKHIWLDVAGYTWNFGKPAVITQEMLNSLVFVYASGNSTTAIISEFQIEEGETATEYTPYIAPETIKVTRYGADEEDNAETFTPNTDGTVSGITSLAPKMTIFTDTEGVNVECEYIKDTNKVIENLIERIIALEGGV